MKFGIHKSNFLSSSRQASCSRRRLRSALRSFAIAQRARHAVRLSAPGADRKIALLIRFPESHCRSGRADRSFRGPGPDPAPRPARHSKFLQAHPFRTTELANDIAAHANHFSMRRLRRNPCGALRQRRCGNAGSPAFSFQAILQACPQGGPSHDTSPLTHCLSPYRRGPFCL